VAFGRCKKTYVPWPDDGAVPVAHHDIVPVFEAVGARAVADPFLAFLEFLE
jgi:hypothetical protein